MPLTIASSLLRRSALRRPFRASSRHIVAFNHTRVVTAGRRVSCARGFASHSASAVASVHSNDFDGSDAKRHSNLTIASANGSGSADEMLIKLEQSIAQRQPSQALAYYNCLESPPSLLMSQKLAILLSKQASEHQTKIAYEILLAVYGSPDFEVDDYTHLASIYTMDACLRHQMHTECMELFKRTNALDIALDLAAYDGFVQALVGKGELDLARDVLTTIVGKKLVVLEESTFLPLLLKMMEQGQYDAIVDLVDHARKNEVVFTFETYDPLVEMGEDVDDSDDEELWNALERFMTYINQALEEDGLTSLLSDDEDDEDISVEIFDDTGDDDDDDDEFDDREY